jgi:hypothetical protein
MDYWKSKQKPGKAIGKPIMERNQEILNTLREYIPHDGKDHVVELRVHREGYGLILRERGLKVDGEPVRSE